MRRAKTAELIEMPFAVLSEEGQRNRALRCLGVHVGANWQIRLNDCCVQRLSGSARGDDAARCKIIGRFGVVVASLVA